MGLRSRVLTAVVVLPVAWALLQQKLTSFLVGFFIQAAAIEEWERAACKKPHGSRLVAHAQAAACFVAGTFGAAAADLAFVAAWLLGTTWRLLQVGAVARAKGGAAAGNGAGAAAAAAHRDVSAAWVATCTDWARVLFVVRGFASLAVIRLAGATGRDELLLVVATAWNADNGGLLFGRLSRRGPLPALRRVSPAKTAAGLWGSLLLGTATTVALTWEATTAASAAAAASSGELGALDGGTALAAAAAPLWLATRLQGRSVACRAAIGAALSLCAICGDLVASLVKRAAGIKDFGSLFPGHGGCLDRLDSVLLSATMYVCIIAWLGTIPVTTT